MWPLHEDHDVNQAQVGLIIAWAKVLMSCSAGSVILILFEWHGDRDYHMNIVIFRSTNVKMQFQNILVSQSFNSCWFDSTYVAFPWPPFSKRSSCSWYIFIHEQWEVETLHFRFPSHNWLGCTNMLAPWQWNNLLLSWVSVLRKPVVNPPIWELQAFLFPNVLLPWFSSWYALA